MNLDYKLEFEKERSRRIALEARLNAIYSNSLLKFFRGSPKFALIIIKFFRSKPNLSLNKIIQKKLFVASKIRHNLIIDLDNADLSSDNVAIFAHWSERSLINKSSIKFIENLINCGYQVLIVSASQNSILKHIPKNVSERITLIRKPNIGYDFGSWLAAFMLKPELFDKSNVLLTNDSIIGPMQNLNNYLEKLNEAPFDVTSFTDSNKYFYHLQSYFLHFKNHSIGKPEIRNFFLKLPLLDFKAEFVLYYEIELTRIIQSSGLYAGAIYPWNTVCTPWENPTLDTPIKLLLKKFPFVKREFFKLAKREEIETLVTNLENLYPQETELIREIKSLY